MWDFPTAKKQFEWQMTDTAGKALMVALGSNWST